MAATQGSKITVKTGGTLYQGLVSKSWRGNTETEDATHQDSGGNKTHNLGDKNWSVGFKSLLDPTHTNGVQQILTAWNAGTDLTVLIEGAVAGEPTITGTANITDCELNMDKGQTASLSGTLTGKGAVTIGTVSA